MTRNDGGRKVSTREPGPRHDSPRKPAGPATPKDGRRETEERLAEGMGGKERHEARKARREDPSLPDPGSSKKDGGTGRR